MIRFCPHCWAESLADAAVCANCGQSLEAEGDYLSKLVAALHHPEPPTPRRAAWVLGKLRDPRAVQPLLRVLEESQDPYLLADAVEALGKIGDERGVGPCWGGCCGLPLSPPAGSGRPWGASVASRQKMPCGEP